MILDRINRSEVVDFTLLCLIFIKVFEVGSVIMPSQSKPKWYSTRSAPIDKKKVSEKFLDSEGL